MAQSEVDEAVDVVEEQRLRAVERALAKIEEGTYGLSDVSGDPIPKARLEAIPEAVPYNPGTGGAREAATAIAPPRRITVSMDTCRRDCQLTTSAIGTFET